MTKISNRGSAKIYKFPARGRAALSGDREAVKPTQASSASVRVPKIEFGNAWYHDAAMEAEKARKR
jgi:hypothetical protein